MKLCEIRINYINHEFCRKIILVKYVRIEFIWNNWIYMKDQYLPFFTIFFHQYTKIKFKSTTCWTFCMQNITQNNKAPIWFFFFKIFIAYTFIYRRWGVTVYYTNYECVSYIFEFFSCVSPKIQWKCSSMLICNAAYG